MKASKDKTEELLREVYQSLKMGSESLCSVTPNVKNKLMLRDITCQLEKYSAYQSRCKDIMLRAGIAPREPSALKKLMTRGSIVMDTVADSSDAHIAQIIVLGTSAGADSLESSLRKCRLDGVSEEAADLCTDVVSSLRRSSGEMKEYIAMQGITPH